MKLSRENSQWSGVSQSMDAESFHYFRRRVVYVMAIGFVISVIYKLLWEWLQSSGLILAVVHSSWMYAFSYSHVFLFAFGLMVALLYPDCPSRLRVVDVAVFGLNIAILQFFLANACVGTDVLFPLALMLFLHAAFVPVPTWTQTVLALIGFVSFPVSYFVILKTNPEFLDLWTAKRPYHAFYANIILGTVGCAIAGVASILITKTLYSLRKNLHKAKRLGNYIIEGEIGRGGMGQVFLAQHSMIRRPTAVKVVDSTSSEGEDGTLARFEREVQLSAELSHPNTITIYDYGRSAEGSFYYAMEYLDGMSLQSFVEKFGPIPEPRTIFLMDQICASLAEAHSKSIIHRDLKPSNIFLTMRGNLYDFVKVLDFGLAKQVRLKGSDGLTKTGMIFGTPRYVAPETVYGQGKVDHRADIYMLGGVLYWMLTGETLFPGKSRVELLVDHVKTSPRKPSEVTEIPISKEIEDVVMKCLSKEPEDRFLCMEDLSEVLRRVPLDNQWTREDAKQWWQMHAPVKNWNKVQSCEKTQINPTRSAA